MQQWQELVCAVLIYLPLHRAVTAGLLAFGAFGCHTLLSDHTEIQLIDEYLCI